MLDRTRKLVFQLSSSPSREYGLTHIHLDIYAYVLFIHLFVFAYLFVHLMYIGMRKRNLKWESFFVVLFICRIGSLKYGILTSSNCIASFVIQNVPSPLHIKGINLTVNPMRPA